jgi:hypothetical protein
MEHWRWRLIHRDGSEISGVDTPPPMSSKLSARWIRVETIEGLNFEVDVPSGFGLILIRRVQFDTGTNLGRIGKDRQQFIIKFEPLTKDRSCEPNGEPKAS